MTRSGADLALLLLAGFRTLADRGGAALAEQGYEDVRPAHDFALRAILAGADTPAELARRLSVTRQSAAKTIAVLEEREFVERAPDPRDGRRLLLTVTDRGHAMMRTGEAVFDDLRLRWEQQSGTATIAALEEALQALVGDRRLSIRSPDWATTDIETD